MKYMGSKNRIAREFLPIVLRGRTSEQWYVEPFCGGCNVVDKVGGLRIAADANAPLVSLFREVQRGWVPPVLSRDDYQGIRKAPESFPAYVVGWAAFGVSYCGKYFGGYAGTVKTRGGERDYQQEALANLLGQVRALDDVHFEISRYDQLHIPPNSIIYCDPPYAGTTGYEGLGPFDHKKFYQWCHEKENEGHRVFISEYAMPDSFICVWHKPLKSSLSANGTSGGSKVSIERLFVPAGGKDLEGLM